MSRIFEEISAEAAADATAKAAVKAKDEKIIMLIEAYCELNIEKMIC